MKVSSIRWMSREAKEAVVELAIGSGSIYAFCQPCDLNVGDTVDGPLYPLDANDFCVSTDEIGFTQDMWEFACRVVGTLSSLEPHLVSVGDVKILINKNDVPRDLKLQDKVEFNCPRLDLDA